MTFQPFSTRQRITTRFPGLPPSGCPTSNHSPHGRGLRPKRCDAEFDIIQLPTILHTAEDYDCAELNGTRKFLLPTILHTAEDYDRALMQPPQRHTLLPTILHTAEDYD